jgi:serine/threonine protein kinase
MSELPLVGTDFAGYRLRAVLGRGGMSIVYQAENPRLRNLIALKVLTPDLAADEIFRTRFREESQIAASLNHPNVIPIHDFGSSHGLLYIAMRYVSGTDLRRLIAERGWLPPDTAVYLLDQAARALDAAHRRGLVHRDVKPGNLLVAQSGSGDAMDPDHVYLADFGITKYVGRPTGLTAAGTVLGTAHYASPEQIQELTVLGTADQYSLGCVLYECLTGRAPFEKNSSEAIMWAHVNERPAPPTLLRPDLPPAIDEVIARVLAKDPGDRYANCREFIAAARDAVATADTWPAASRSPADGSPGQVPAGPPDYGAPGARMPLAGRPDEFQPAPVSSGMFPENIRPTVKEPRDPTESVILPGGVPGRPAFSFDDGRPVRTRRVRGRRARGRGPGLGGTRSALSLAAIGVSVAVIAAGGTAAGMLLSKTSDVATGGPRTSAPASPPVSTLTTVLDRTEQFTGMLRMSTCMQQTATLVQCTKPDPAIASVTFATYPTLGALYAKYQEIVGNLTGGHFAGVANLHTCGPLAPEPTAESTWNHSDQYFTKYSVAQLASGDVPDDVAMGRMFCEQTQNGSEYIVWTQDSGRLLGYATGAASHEQVWSWFYTVHHNITFPGQQGMTDMPTSPAGPGSAPGSGSGSALGSGLGSTLGSGLGSGSSRSSGQPVS